jgi:hypothetical protein
VALFAGSLVTGRRRRALALVTAAAVLVVLPVVATVMIITVVMVVISRRSLFFPLLPPVSLTISCTIPMLPVAGGAFFIAIAAFNTVGAMSLVPAAVVLLLVGLLVLGALLGVLVLAVVTSPLGSHSLL